MQEQDTQFNHNTHNNKRQINTEVATESQAVHAHATNKRQRRTSQESSTNVYLLLAIVCTTMFTLGGTIMLSTAFLTMEEVIVNSENARKRNANEDRKDWSYYDGKLSDVMFYRLFRMNRQCFRKLCQEIEKAVGKIKFKSESYVNEQRRLRHTTLKSSMFHCNQSTSGEWIQGETKVAVTLRYLAGASYLDLFLAFHISPNHILAIINEVKRDWLCHDKVLAIDFYKDVLESIPKMAQMSEQFAESSGGILVGCIGAVDGWLCRINCPAKREVKNPGKYMSRKGFFAINVQVICDKRRRILWSSIGAKGSSHDSTVFKDSVLYRNLMEKADWLHEHGYYLVGDSAYALRGFLLCPYDNAKKGSAEDNYNFFHSSQRIHIECAFGELTRRFGVFWRPLEGSLLQHRFTIESCFRIHNFIVNYREDQVARGVEADYELEDGELMHHYNAFSEDNPFQDMDVVGDNERLRGRTRGDEVHERDRGINMRAKMCQKIKIAGIARPTNR